MNAVGIPEDGSAITWTFMCEYKATIEYMPNVLGYWPLDMGNIFKGWCGDNAMDSVQDPLICIPLINRTLRKTPALATNSSTNNEVTTK